LRIEVKVKIKVKVEKEVEVNSMAKLLASLMRSPRLGGAKLLNC